MLFDHLGRKIERSRLSGELERDDMHRRELVNRVYPGNGLSPERLTRILAEADQGRPQEFQSLCDDMEDRSGHLSAVLMKRALSVAGREVMILPANGTRPARKAADYCRELIGGLPALSETLTMLQGAIYRGYRLQEIVWDITPSDVSVREILDWDTRLVVPNQVNAYELRRLTSREMVSGEPLEDGKWLQHVYRARNPLPVRAGVGRTLAWYHMFSGFSLKDWLEFSELYGTPARVGFYPQGIAKEDKAVLRRALLEFGHDLAAMLPDGARLEFPDVGTKGASADLYERLIKLCHAEMSKIVLGQTLTTEQQSNGARALGQVHQDAELEIKRADARAVANTLRRDLLTPAVAMQLGTNYPVPVVSIDVEDPAAQLEQVRILVDMGLPVGQNWLYSRFGVPAPEEGEVVVVPRAKGVTPASPTAGRNAHCPHCGEPDEAQKKSPLWPAEQAAIPHRVSAYL